MLVLQTYWRRAETELLVSSLLTMATKSDAGIGQADPTVGPLSQHYYCQVCRSAYLHGMINLTTIIISSTSSVLIDGQHLQLSHLPIDQSTGTDKESIR